VTGVTVLAVELGSRRLQLLHELVPAGNTIGLVVNPANPTAENETADVEATARTLGLQLRVLKAGSEDDLDLVFQTLGEMRVDGLVIGADPYFISRISHLAALAIRHKVPTIYQFREFAAAGGLMSYGGSLTDAYNLAGAYTARVLKGEKPEDLPVQQSTRVELIINLKTAKAFGLAVPLPLLVRADEVIE
jgi:putative tryptophan/tyrosine transport system substrate-binding protein